VQQKILNIYTDIWNILWPQPEIEIGPLFVENNLLIVRKRINELVALKHSPTSEFLAANDNFFNLLFWAIYSDEEMTKIMEEIRFCGMIENLSKENLKKLSNFALKGLEKAWKTEFPFDENLISMEWQFSLYLIDDIGNN
jgi:hypothetical protein